jgi:hypothetical protein
MRPSLRALAGTIVLSGALCVTATGTAQATSGTFACPHTNYNPATTTVSTILCTGGPANATSGTITDQTTQAFYDCGYLSVTPFGSFFSLVTGTRCTPL